MKRIIYIIYLFLLYIFECKGSPEMLGSLFLSNHSITTHYASAFLLTDYTFPRDAAITKLKWSPISDGEFFIQIWRPINGSGFAMEYVLITQRSMEHGRSSRIAVFELGEEELLPIRAGDVLGVQCCPPSCPVATRVEAQSSVYLYSIGKAQSLDLNDRVLFDQLLLPYQFSLQIFYETDPVLVESFSHSKDGSEYNAFRHKTTNKDRSRMNNTEDVQFISTEINSTDAKYVDAVNILDNVSKFDNNMSDNVDGYLLLDERAPSTGGGLHQVKQQKEGCWCKGGMSLLLLYIWLLLLTVAFSVYLYLHNKTIKHRSTDSSSSLDGITCQYLDFSTPPWYSQPHRVPPGLQPSIPNVKVAGIATEQRVIDGMDSRTPSVEFACTVEENNASSERANHSFVWRRLPSSPIWELSSPKTREGNGAFRSDECDNVHEDDMEYQIPRQSAAGKEGKEVEKFDYDAEASYDYIDMRRPMGDK